MTIKSKQIIRILPKFLNLMLCTHIKEAVKISRFRNNSTKSYQQIIKVLKTEFYGKIHKKIICGGGG